MPRLKGLRRFSGFLKHPSSVSLEAWLTAILIVLLTVVVFYALVGTDQGRDLVRLAQDRNSAVILFWGLSVAMILFMALLMMIVTSTPASDPPRSFLDVIGIEGKLFNLAIFTAIGMA